MRRPAARLVVTLVMVTTLAFGCAHDPTTNGDQPTGTTSPVTAPTGTEPTWDDAATTAAREAARGLLGMYERDLPDDVRVARRGDESFPVTDDYVLGRRTVELDAEANGYRVTAVIVELPDGPETFVLQGG